MREFVYRPEDHGGEITFNNFNVGKQGEDYWVQVGPRAVQYEGGEGSLTYGWKTHGGDGVTAVKFGEDQRIGLMRSQPVNTPIGRFQVDVGAEQYEDAFGVTQRDTFFNVKAVKRF